MHYAKTMLLLLSACTAPPPPENVATPTPWVSADQTGPYRAGVTTLRFTDDRGKELVLEVWYPASDPGTPPDPYDELPFTRAAHRDAAWIPSPEPRPLVVFSHGYGGIRYQNTFLTEHLATHGLVVLGVDHPHNTLYDLDADATSTVLAERPGDIRRAVDHLASDPRIATDSYVMMGHSFGAFTSLVVGGGALDVEAGLDWCARESPPGCSFFGEVEGLDISDAKPDPRAIASIAISPGGWYAFGDTGLETTVPTLAIAGDGDEDLPYTSEARPTMERLPRATLATIHDTGHWAVTDLCMLIPTLVDCAGPPDWAPYEEVQSRMKTLVTAYARNALTGDDRDTVWLEASTWDEDPGITLERTEAQRMD